jgi:isopenicillin-N N-acyltransferase-like protein
MKLRTFEFSGTPRAIGEAFGETCRVEIAELYQRRLKNAIAQAKEYGGRKVGEGAVLEVARRSLPATEGYDASGYAELVGIARGANLGLEQVFAMNGLTDLRDVLAWFGELEALGGCSSFIVQGDRTKDGRALGGQTWDLSTDNMPYLVGVHRRPKDGPATWSLTTVGCLSLIAMNEEGLAIGTTNLRTKDARPGVCYLSVIHKALRMRSFEDACRAVISAHRAGAHYYWLVHKTGQAAAIECTATMAERIDVARGRFVHCNHSLVEQHKKLEAAAPAESSSCRQTRLDELIESERDRGLDDATMRRFLTDHDNGEQAICRHDLGGISSNGAAILCPAAPSFSACQGHPCTAEWTDLLAGQPAAGQPSASGA